MSSNSLTKINAVFAARTVPQVRAIIEIKLTEGVVPSREELERMRGAIAGSIGMMSNRIQIHDDAKSVGDVVFSFDPQTCQHMETCQCRELAEKAANGRLKPTAVHAQGTGHSDR